MKTLHIFAALTYTAHATHNFSHDKPSLRCNAPLGCVGKPSQRSFVGMVTHKICVICGSRKIRQDFPLLKTVRRAKHCSSCDKELILQREHKLKSLEGEEWRDVVGYEGLYEVSNFGRVKSMPRKYSKGGMNTIFKDRDGYSRVAITNTALGLKTKGVHRLVAQAFIPNPENKPAVNHLDSNRRNNRVENLEWCTNKENTRHAILHGNALAVGVKNPRCKLTEEEVLKIRASAEKNRALAISHKVTWELIHAIKTRKLWKHLP